MKHELNFYTQYNQFYIVDEKDNVSDTSKLWTDEDVFERLAVDSGILGVYTECYGPVKGEIEILNSQSVHADFEHYDHVVEGLIDIKSGVMQIHDCPNSEVELEVKVTPGRYRVRVYSSNLRSVVGDDGNDYYKIEAWLDKSEKTERTVLKQYRP